jgi:hypothetical protein
LNPLNWDTVGGQIEFDDKFFGGLEINPIVIYVDGDDLRNFRFREMAVGVGSSIDVSVGASYEMAGGLTFIGTDGSVLDQKGISDLNGNLGVCANEFAVCGKVSGSYDFEEQRLSSIAWSGGTGTGLGDVSIGTTITHLWFYKDKDNLLLNIPGFPPITLPTTANPNP